MQPRKQDLLAKLLKSSWLEDVAGENMCPDFSTSLAEGGSASVSRSKDWSSLRLGSWPFSPTQTSTGHNFWMLWGWARIPRPGRAPGAELLPRRLRQLLRSDRRRQACRATCQPPGFGRTRHVLLKPSSSCITRQSRKSHLDYFVPNQQERRLQLPGRRTSAFSEFRTL